MVLSFDKISYIEIMVDMQNTWQDISPQSNLLKVQELLDEKFNSVSYRWLPWFGNKVVGIFRNQKQLPISATLVATPRSSLLSWEALSIKDSIDSILNQPIRSAKERLLHQIEDKKYLQELLSNLSQKVSIGALADNNIRLSGESQKQTELFSRQFGNALKATLEWQFPGSQIPGAILQIYRGIVMSWLDPTKSTNWQQSLQEITIDTSNKIDAWEFARRVNSIFEIFVENYVKTLRVREI